MNERDPAGQQNRERVFRHLLEVATAWTIVRAGKDYDVASGRDSVEAARLILSYDLGLPRKQEDRIELPEGLDPQAPLLDLAAAIYRHRMLSGRMGESEFSDMVKAILSVDQTKIGLILKILGPNVAGKSEDEIRALLTGATSLARQEPAPPANVAPAKAGEAEGGFPASSEMTSVNAAGRASAGESLQSTEGVAPQPSATFAQSGGFVTPPGDEDDE